MRMFTKYYSVTGASSRKTFLITLTVVVHLKRVYPEVPGLAAWSENCKWYISLPLGAVVSLFRESL
jgi:hypothetical protein